MKTPLILLAIVAAVLAAFHYFGPSPALDGDKPRTDLPWQIQVEPDRSSRVFDLHLGHSTLADAQAKFGLAEGYAVFERNAEQSDLEVYFGKVSFGLLQARVVVQLVADEPFKRQLMSEANKRESSPTGDWKYVLPYAVGEQLQSQRIAAISYVPGTRSLDAAFYHQRFGEPAGVVVENEQARSWFYPQQGLTILIDDEGPEVLEYIAPRDFVSPEKLAPFVAPAPVD